MKTKIIPKDEWIWMPHPAHFIMGNYCRFHLATKVGKYIVSTVGELWTDSVSRHIHAQVFDPKWNEDNKELMGDAWDAAYYRRFGYDDLHMENWKYETMVFSARKTPKDGCKVCPYEINVEKNHEEEWYKNAKEAHRGHMKLCEKYSAL